MWKIDLRPYPRFDVRVLEQKGDTKVWIDEMGVTRVDHVRPATPGFVTRTYLDFPVKNRDGFLEMTQRYNPLEPMRFLPQAAEAPSDDPATWRFDAADESIYLNKLERYNAGPDPVMLVVRGLFWTLRDWCGFEQLCMMFYDRPGLVHEMMDFWTDFIEKLYRPVLPVAKVDLVMVNEDMAYKHQSMISLEMMREFLIPRYTRLIRFFKSMNVDVVTMDSDGHVSQILETFVPAGLDGIEPMEIAAGNDPAEYFGKYPRLIGWGGIDKRELRFDKARVRAEVRKRFEVQRTWGRYLPCVDHGTPPDMPLRNFLYMVELIKGFSNGEDLDTYDPPCELEKHLGPIEEMFHP